MISAVLIIPAADLAKANTLAIYMGWGPNSYSVPLTSDGTTTTHWGLHTWADDAFVAMLTAAGQGQMPQALIDAGYPPADFAAVVGSLIASLTPDVAGHFASVCGANGLALVEAPSTRCGAGSGTSAATGLP
jgi:hypothetical protein